MMVRYAPSLLLIIGMILPIVGTVLKPKKCKPMLGKWEGADFKFYCKENDNTSPSSYNKMKEKAAAISENY